MSARLLSLNVVARPQLLAHGQGSVSSAIFKRPVTTSLWLGLLGLDGDTQADQINHGGPDKAVCVYPSEHYPDWSAVLERDLQPGAFGENFHTAGLLETEAAIGDVYRVGTALVQVSQPRQPCFKLSARQRDQRMVPWVRQSGRTGFYLRCLEPGLVAAGDAIDLVERAIDTVTIADINRALYLTPQDVALLTRIIAANGLAESLRRNLEGRLEALAQRATAG